MILVDNDQIGPLLEGAKESLPLKIIVIPDVLIQMLDGRPEHARQLAQHELLFGADLSVIGRQFTERSDSRIAHYKPFYSKQTGRRFTLRLQGIEREEVAGIIQNQATQNRRQTIRWLSFFEHLRVELKSKGIARKFPSLDEAWCELESFLVHTVLNDALARRASRERLSLIAENPYMRRHLKALLAAQLMFAQLGNKEVNRKPKSGPDVMTDLRLFLYTGPDTPIISRDGMVRRIASMVGDVRVISADEYLGGIKDAA